MSLNWSLNRCCQVIVTRYDETVKYPHLPLNARPVAPGESRGSGWVFQDPDTMLKYVVTNHHVINAAKTIQVVFPLNMSQRVECRLWFTCPYYDLAWLAIPPEIAKSVEAVAIGTSINLTSDVQLYAIGYPLGMTDQQIIKGYKTGYHTTAKEVYIQHNASLNPGNSGGPLLVKDNSPQVQYRIVGVNNAIIANAQAIDFSIPVERVMQVFRMFKLDPKQGRVLPRFDMGFSIQASNLALKEYYLKGSSAPKDISGVVVVNVSACGNDNDDEALIQTGDFIYEVHGLRVMDSGLVMNTVLGTPMTLECYLSLLGHEEYVEIELYRKKVKQSVAIEINYILNPVQAMMSYSIPWTMPPFELVSGVVLMDCNEQALVEFKDVLPRLAAPCLLIVNVIPEGEVYQSQKQVVLPAIAKTGCMIVHSINDMVVHSLAEFHKHLTEIHKNDASKDFVLRAFAPQTPETVVEIVLFHELVQFDNEVITSAYPHLDGKMLLSSSPLHIGTESDGSGSSEANSPLTAVQVQKRHKELAAKEIEDIDRELSISLGIY